MLKILNWVKAYLVICLLTINCVYAVSSGDVSQNLDNLVGKINQVNSDLSSKQKRQQNLSKAINNSDLAISQSENILGNLKQKQQIDEAKLEEIESQLPKLTKAVENVESNVKVAINNIYKDLVVLQSNEHSSILNGNDNVQAQRKKQYLISLLQTEQGRYNQLQDKLNKLKELNDSITLELEKIEKQLGMTTKQKLQLQQDKQVKMTEQLVLQKNINNDKTTLSNLKEQQAKLNKLLLSLKTMEQQDSNLPSSQVAKPNKVDVSIKPKMDYENDSSFLSAQLSKPVDNAQILVKFGAMRGGVPNNGVLLGANNLEVHSIASGRVLFSGVLPGFGQMVVVDHGHNYVSIYGGILSQVKKNQALSANQVIGTSGTTANQPMGGVYFELRHFGKPVNPSKFIQ